MHHICLCMLLIACVFCFAGWSADEGQGTGSSWFCQGCSWSQQKLSWSHPKRILVFLFSVFVWLIFLDLSFGARTKSDHVITSENIKLIISLIFVYCVTSEYLILHSQLIVTNQMNNPSQLTEANHVWPHNINIKFIYTFF